MVLVLVGYMLVSHNAVHVHILSHATYKGLQVIRDHVKGSMSPKKGKSLCLCLDPLSPSKTKLSK